MVWRKALAMLFALLMVSTAVGFGRAAADTQVTVILVSDNEADSALAQYLANLTGAVVVVTPWGVYDPNVTAEITGYAPDSVIIIGGPDAVVEQYVSDLQDLNITVERWWGKTRYETNLAVIGNATVRLKIKFENHVIVVPGNDTAGIQEALRRAVKVHGFIIFANNSTDVVRIMAKFQVWPKNVTIIRSRVMERVAERVLERLRNRTVERGNITEVELNITPEMALEAINMSEERISTAEELLANVSLPEQKEWLAQKMLALAKEELERAKEAYEEGRYGRAYGQAIAAKAHAEFVIRIASKEWLVKVQFDPAARALMFLHRVEIQLKIMERAGVNVTRIQELVDQLKVAIENRDYDAIDSLMEQIREELMNMYWHGKAKLRERIIMPARGRHGRP